MAQAAPIPADPIAAPRADWLELPRVAFGLLIAHWPVLAFWFFAQELAGMLLLRLSVQLGYVSHLLGFVGLALMVVVQLLCTIAMFDALRAVVVPPLAADADTASAAAETGAVGALRHFGAVLAIVLLPFFAYYASWGLLGDSIRAYVLEFMLGGSSSQRSGVPTDLLQSRGLWLSIVLTYALRRVLLWWQQSHPGAVWSILATTCQAYWVFLGLYAIKNWTDAVWAWGEQRVAWQWVVDALTGAPDPSAITPAANEPGPGDAQRLFSAVVLGRAGSVAQALLLPLAWFAIAAIVYGRDLREARSLFRSDARLEYARRRYAALSVPLRRATETVVEKASAGWHAKGVPVVNAMRLLLGAGLRPMLALCVGYVALDVVCDRAWRAIAALIGPHDSPVWEIFGAPLTILFGGPLDLEPSLLGEPARICLLAAAVKLAMRQRERQREHRRASAQTLSDAGSAGSAAAASAG